MELKEVIERIGYFRNKANLSARALSCTTDKNKAYITKLEAGEYEPSMRVILDIINACGITPEEFFYSNINFLIYSGLRLYFCIILLLEYVCCVH